jgi:hypothetical protein
MSIKWDIAEKINKAADTDMMTALEQASDLIAEFLKSGQTEETYGIMANGKCMDIVIIKKGRTVENK